MNNLDDSENNAKVSDSAYSNSCSNSHSRRSRSSKSTHSGSHSSGSSGYGGKPTSSSSNDQNQPPEKRSKDKDSKKKKTCPSEGTLIDAQIEEDVAPATVDEVVEPPNESPQIDAASPAPPPPPDAVPDESMVTSVTPEPSVGKEDFQVISMHTPLLNQLIPSSACRPCVPVSSDGFWCVISMHDGVVMFTTSSITTALGYPKEMWIGRSFIDFVHPRDRGTFASQITSGLVAPKHVKVETFSTEPISTMFCRMRRYRGLTNGFGVKDKCVIFTPFLLKLSFKNINDDNGKTVYLVIQASPFVSIFKVPNEVMTKAVPFVLRHSAQGILEYVSSESVPFLGYLPQELTDKDALQLYHPDDLPYLNTVYETIVREGAAPRSESYRMMSQNGHYVRLETEWSSFINPWSRKLEFVTGKHYTVEGPTNPDVFQTPDPEKSPKMTEDEQKTAQALRDSIVKVINEMLTKPAEVAKQQMSKRCQDLASFMEVLLAEQTKTEEELRLEIQEPDHNYYERDSVMLGGISPHHDYTDGDSNTDTPLSYNQLNYNETLQRYFDSYHSRPGDEHQAVADESMSVVMSDLPINSRICPMVTSGDSSELTSSGESSAADISAAHLLRLTESLITKHNQEMEKELVKKHREPRFSCRGERDKANKENRQKKKEHLARCNARFQPTAAGVPLPEPEQSEPHGVKRASRCESGSNRQKHHCSAARQPRSRRHTPPCTFTEPTNQWGAQYPMGVNTFVQDSRLSQQIPPVMSSVAAMPRMFPMYYVPTPVSNSGMHVSHQQNNPSTFQHPVQYMMYPQPVYGSPFMYSPISPQVAIPVPQTLVQQSTVHLTGTHLHNTIAMTTSSLNANKSAASAKPAPPKPPLAWADQGGQPEQGGDIATRLCFSSNALQRSTEAVPEETPKKESSATREENVDRTDESSHSSFYSSSFFKTESGSAEENSDSKAKAKKELPAPPQPGGYEPYEFKKVARRKIVPPWMEEVCVTSELIYKYQVVSKNVEEVLLADKRKMLALEQPSLVNEQLGQLYIDLQLEGVAARLTLEEGLTSSGSSGEENTNQNKVGLMRKSPRRKREYSKLAMIYEEDAPLPSPPEECKSS